MRVKVVNIIVIVFLSSLVLAQQGPNKKFKQSHSIETVKEENHSFQNLLIQNSFNATDSIHKVLCLDFLNSIQYHNIPHYNTAIETIYKKSKNTFILDTAFFLQCLKSKSLLSYQEYNFKQAIEEFRIYFKIYQSYYHNDTSYAFVYSKYSYLIQITKPTEQFYAVADSAIQIANKKVIPYNDLARAYNSIGNYFKFGRRLDTARYLLNLAKYNVDKAPVRDFNLSSKLSKSLGELELLDANVDLSISYYTAALEFLLKTEHTNLQIARIYRSKATAMLYSNRIIDAINQYKMAQFIFEKELPKNHQTIISIYRFLGLANMRIGEDSIGINYLIKAVNLDSSPNSFLATRNLAEAYSQVDSIEKADLFFKSSLSNSFLHQGELSYQTSVTYYSYGQFLLEKINNFPLGEEYLGKCIQIRYDIYNEKNIDISDPLNILGTHYIINGKIEQGLDSLQSALIIAINDFNSKDIYTNPAKDKFVKHYSFHNTLAWKAYGLYLKYLKTNNLKDLEMSFQTYDQFIYLAKEMRKYYKDTENIINAAEIEYVFSQAVDIGRQLYDKTNKTEYIEKIFEFIEGKKSFTLLNSLRVLENKKLLKVPKELLEKEANFKSQLGRLNEIIAVEKSSTNNSEIIRSLDSTIFYISLSLDSIHTKYKNEYSGFYNLKYGFKELSLQDIEPMVPNNQAFLNYSLSDSLLSILCITSNGTKIFNKTIDSSFTQEVNIMVKLLKEFNTDNSYSEFHQFLISSRLLYNYLIKPAEKYIEGKELVIIPDGVLNYLSFDALLTHDIIIERPDYRKLPYLIKKHKTNVANSMQIYFNMKTRPRKSNNKVFAFAPYYQEPQDTTGLPIAYQYLRPLDYAKTETSTIAKYLPTNLYINKNATRDTFVSIATDAKILHLAMHTIINDDDPMYSKLLFTFDKEKKSGLVNTYELLTMDLNAELAVLSGCSTGDGELQKGEGVMSLSSGFQYAGVPAIIMSLWEVNDRFGSLVIENFYKNIANGLPKNQALHQAKLKVLSQGNALYSHPYYWSGLTLMGDESEISFKPIFHFYYIFYILVFISFLVFLYIKLKQ